MALFRYFALSEEGKKISGLIDADNLEEAKLHLSTKEIIVTKLFLFKQYSKRSNFSKRQLYHFCRELAKLLQAGLPLYEALVTLEEKYRNSRCHSVIFHLSDQVKEGISLSQAASSYPQSFDFLFCSMIANAEKTGRLEMTLEEIADIILKRLTLKRQLGLSLLYPAILAGFCLVVIVALLFFVIPSLFELFEGKNMHPFTHFVLSCSKWACRERIIISLIFFSMGAIVFSSFCCDRGRRVLRRISLSIPLIRKIIFKLAMARFCRSLATLLKGGVAYLEAIRLARKVMNHPPLEKAIKSAEKRILEGSFLSCELKHDSHIPPFVIRMLAIGEESGDTTNMLYHISDIYEDEIERALAQITSFVQPIMLLILGGVVGFVVLSILLPLTDVSSFIT